MGLTEGISRPSTETIMSGHISALSETVISECFATQSANLTVGRKFRPIFTTGGYCIDNKVILNQSRLYKLILLRRHPFISFHFITITNIKTPGTTAIFKIPPSPQTVWTSQCRYHWQSLLQTFRSSQSRKPLPKQILPLDGASDMCMGQSD